VLHTLTVNVSNSDYRMQLLLCGMLINRPALKVNNLGRICHENVGSRNENDRQTSLSVTLESTGSEVVSVGSSTVIRQPS